MEASVRYMDNPVDKRGKLEAELFSYKITKDRKVFISYNGRLVTTLSGTKAESFITEIDNIDGIEAQLVMAKATGHFKHGNEKSVRRRL